MKYKPHFQYDSSVIQIESYFYRFSIYECIGFVCVCVCVCVYNPNTTYIDINVVICTYIYDSYTVDIVYMCIHIYMHKDH
jgi:hypothetical protein